MIHKGHNDPWAVTAMVLSTAALLGLEKYWIGLPLVAILALWLWPQRYRTERDGIEIQAGLVRRWIPYETIRFVGPCSGGRNLALAVHGVSIQYGLNSEIRISPSDTAAFLADIACKSPHLVKRGRNLTISLA